MTNTMESLSWIVWQLRAVSLWLVWSNRYMLVTNRYSYVVMTVWTKGDFGWYLTVSDRPTSWRFVWYLYSLSSVSVHNSCVNSLAVAINVVNCCSLSIRRISYSDCLILSAVSNLGCWDITLTCSVARYSWNIVVCPFTSCPLTVSYFTSDFINIGIVSQLNFLYSCLSLAIWSCNFDRASNRLV